MAGEFRRRYSKVWWANYLQDKETNDTASSVPCTSGGRTFTNVDVNRILCSSSPSNGSHRSQDSGFSDSESSSPPTHCPPSTNGNRSSGPALAQRVENFPIRTCHGIRELSVNGIIPRAQFRKQKKQTKHTHVIEETNETTASHFNVVDNYLADCCHQMTKYNNKINRATYLGRRSSANLCPAEGGQTEKIATANESRNRTCFVVDEIPKKIPNGSDLVEESTSTSSSSFSYDETVRLVERKHVDIVNQKSRSLNLSLIASTTPQKTNESKSSTLDSSRLPEPPFTSTPKKCEVKLRTVEKTMKPSAPSMLDDEICKLADPPVAVWLLELQRRHETECTTMLQSKAIARCYKKQTSKSVVLSQSFNSMQIFQERTKLIARDFLKLYDKLYSDSLVFVRSHTITLTNSIKELVVNNSQSLLRLDSSERDNMLQLLNLCDHLKKIVESADQFNLTKDIDFLEKLFYRFVDSVLVQQILYLFSALEQPNSETSLLNALYGISNLDLSSSFALDFIDGRLNGVGRLLAISYESTSPTVRKAALRALTVVCQNGCNIQQWEKARGIDGISKMLSDLTKDESELSEIISVLVQITAPWVENDRFIAGLSYNLYTILNALTRIISTSISSETLLLCAAATVNISFIEPQVTKMLLNLNTATFLLTAVRKLGVKASIFLQEQVATLIANMASELEARQQFAENRAVGALLCFLQVKHSALLTDAEMVAAERLQHKSAITLSRLCSNQEISKQVVELHGVELLVRLCKEKKERNHNDGVLVACLSSLRKITSICGSGVVNNLNTRELVELGLVDSYLLYSSRQESYV